MPRRTRKGTRRKNPAPPPPPKSHDGKLYGGYKGYIVERDIPLMTYRPVQTIAVTENTV